MSFWLIKSMKHLNSLSNRWFNCWWRFLSWGYHFCVDIRYQSVKTISLINSLLVWRTVTNTQHLFHSYNYKCLFRAKICRLEIRSTIKTKTGLGINERAHEKEVGHNSSKITRYWSVQISDLYLNHDFPGTCLQG